MVVDIPSASLVQASTNAPNSDISVRVITIYAPAAPLDEPFLYRVAKRIFDVFFSGIALILLIPVFLIVGAFIWFEDRGSVFYSQHRVGRFGVPINFYKFRSMVVKADALKEQLLAQSDAVGTAFKMKNDPRVTKVGRFIRKYSVDELPQLVSVFLGDMSIIGPRPLPLAEGYACTGDQTLRYLVKPGLLCLREISGRSKLSFEEWMRLDAQYVQTRGILLDLKILMCAVPAVLKADGAY